MQIHKLPFEKTGFFSRLFLDYLNKKNGLEKFYDLYPLQENFLKKAKSLQFSEGKRKVLHEELLKQYESFTVTSKTKDNINALINSNTFTITTGHQLNIFTGPLYFILKIVAVIKAAEQLNQSQNEIKFVPVYWMATEDHDVEEINHFYLFNKKLTWNTDEKGPVGKFSTAGFEQLFPEIKDKLPLFEKAYMEHKTLANATRYIVNELFGDKGLVIIDGDSKALKAQCRDLFKDELSNNVSFNNVKNLTDELTNCGYGGQVYPREINLFYMEKGLRERIIKEENVYKINNTELKFSEKEMESVLKSSIEKISPNVVLRPVYQELILPNIAYCGGPAELSYWLQLKSLFNYYKIEFPILLPRAFSMIVPRSICSKVVKLKLTWEELFEEEQKLKEKIIATTSQNEYKLEVEEQEVDSLFEKIKGKASAIDPTLEAYVLAEGQKIKKALEQIEKRLKKAEEQKHEVLISQLSNIKSKLFPEGQLQERRDNYLNFSLSNPAFISQLFQLIDPFDYRFNIIVEDE
jgi:bacillithiol biosynthesis cysteine-adding enzyme BshC